jgi:benzoyl-CoA-dihydrodiol lyase
VSARSLVALIQPGSCFAGTLAELALAADRSLILDGQRDEEGDVTLPPPAALVLTDVNDGPLPMANGLSRLATRYWGHPEQLDAVRAALSKELLAADCRHLGLVTLAPDDLDWDDEVRLTLEERAAFSADALTGMEASLRFAGPETLETKIFGRLSAWQNWIFLRSNATGVEGALRRYGTGSRPVYDRGRV